MSMETQGGTAPLTQDVLAQVDELFANIDLRTVHFDSLAGGEISDEVLSAIGKLSDADFVKLLYTEILRRDGEPDAVAFWVGELQNGASRDTLVDSFAKSAESVSISSPDEIALLGLGGAVTATTTTDM